MADPSYPCNRQLVDSFGGRVVSVPTTTSTRYQLAASSVAAAWTSRTRAIMAATPLTRRAASIPRDEIAAISLSRLTRPGGSTRHLALHLSARPQTAPPGRSAIGRRPVDPDAIVLNSLSKYCGMTGWRLGWSRASRGSSLARGRPAGA